MSSRRASVRALVLVVVLALAGCTDTSNQNPPSTTRTVASATSTTTPQVATCPLGDRCPRPKITPGTVIPGTVGVCQASYNPRRNLTAAAKARVLAAYGLTPGTKVAEWDHLIARWAGGDSTPRNIWPTVNAHEKQRKDVLENRLYLAFCKHDSRQVAPAMVRAACGGTQLTLECAREMMRNYWQWW